MILQDLVAQALVQHRLVLAAQVGSTSLTGIFPDFDDAQLDELKRHLTDGMTRLAHSLAICATLLEAIEERQALANLPTRARW